ncbi:MAG TPA: NADH-quinone oxidoreductase subunit N [Gemmatimonadaceae bacterium]|jgi:NADH-quinone oxidoreductase subunit N|nr:NADH-quinone oxidoreductase subunit N [Gemmatimonadota bacterium]HNV73488.1 NADH-quinone oxidoreductase subunit N [Gemmatimonadaceae bacterium]HPV75118.1 NADH-quinone oxidoreductase subunit N [Gemmatimonadaceae bacterium]
MHYDLSIPAQLTMALGPDLVLLGGAMVLMLAAAWGPDSIARQRSVGLASIGLAVVVLVAVVFTATRNPTAGAGVIAVDGFRWAADALFLLAAIIAIALSVDYNAREGILAGEAHVLTIFAVGGMMLMAAARDLMVLFLGIELMSIAVYVLAGLNRRSARAAEGSLKYFLLGAFSTAFLLYGIALVYGATGSTNLTEIGARIASLNLSQSPMLLVGVALLLVGFGFKLAAAPFHMWAPDVYEGAPTPISGFMAAGVKAAAFAAFLRVWLEAFPGVYAEWHKAVWWIAATTMIVGNIIALQQKNLKRMLAYSSIGHTGFILVALAAGTPQAATAFLFYLFAYTLATMGAFAVLIAVGQSGSSGDRIEDLHGLWNTNPGLAISMMVFMLALLGFPVFGGMGFFAKWYVLQSAIQAPAPQIRLAIVLVLTSTISAGYYVPVVMAMFMKPRAADAPTVPAMPGLTKLVVGGAVALILFFGVYPDPIVRLAKASSSLGVPAATGAPAQPGAPAPSTAPTTGQ